MSYTLFSNLNIKKTKKYHEDFHGHNAFPIKESIIRIKSYFQALWDIKKHFFIIRYEIYLYQTHNLIRNFDCDFSELGTMQNVKTDKKSGMNKSF